MILIFLITPMIKFDTEKSSRLLAVYLKKSLESMIYLYVIIGSKNARHKF